MGSQRLAVVTFSTFLAVFLGGEPILGSSWEPLAGLPSVPQVSRLPAQRHLDHEPGVAAFQNGALPTRRAQQAVTQPIIFFGNLIAVALAVIYIVVKCYRTINTDRVPTTKTRRLSGSGECIAVTTTPPPPPPPTTTEETTTDTLEGRLAMEGADADQILKLDLTKLQLEELRVEDLLEKLGAPKPKPLGEKELKELGRLYRKLRGVQQLIDAKMKSTGEEATTTTTDPEIEEVLRRGVSEDQLPKLDLDKLKKEERRILDQLEILGAPRPDPLMKKERLKLDAMNIGMKYKRLRAVQKLIRAKEALTTTTTRRTTTTTLGVLTQPQPQPQPQPNQQRQLTTGPAMMTTTMTTTMTLGLIGIGLGGLLLVIAAVLYFRNRSQRYHELEEEKEGQR